MTFAWPHLLWLLALPLGLLAWELAERRRAHNGNGRDKILRGEAGARQVRLQAGARASQPVRRVWLCLGLVFCIAALARPQWGKIDEQVFDQSREILIALDLSKSMLSQDVKPSRLERSKLLVQVLLDRLKGERVGLLVFSGTSFLQCPLSTDYEILRDFLPALGPDTLPEGGTNYSSLLRTALQAFSTGDSADRYLIILSDGEALDSNWKALVPDLAKRNVRVIGLGVGTTAGAMIPDGSGGLVKDSRGAVVMSKLEPATLEELASATHGTYRDASSWIDLASVLKQTVEAGRAGAFTEKREQRAIERFQWVLAPGVLCLLLSFAFEFPVRVRPRSVAPARQAAAKPGSPPQPPVIAAALALVAALALTPPARAAGTEAKGPATPLGFAVERLATKPSLTAPDCADLARQTLSWGQSLQGSGQPLPDGPLRDALDAIDRGSETDPAAANWDELRSQIEKLREKPPEQQQKKPQQQKPQDKQDQQKQKSSSEQQKSSSEQQQKQDQQNQDSQQQQQQQNDEKNPAQQQQGGQQQAPQQQQSAFGDMKKPQPPAQSQPQAQPPSAEEMQKVGGQPVPKEDSALLVPLEKLQKVKNQDSPGRLFELMNNDQPKPQPAANQKDW